MLIAVAIVFGGGGAPAPLTGLLVQLTAAVEGIVFFLQLPTGKRPPRMAWVLVALTAAIPVLYLIPLPPAIWHMLPGRQSQIDALTLVGLEESWRPVALSPARTLASLLSLLPPAMVLLMVSSLPPEKRVYGGVTIVVIGMISLLVGVAQVAAGSGSDAFRLYAESNSGWLVGFQANRNAQADVLTILLVSWVAFAMGRSPIARRIEGIEPPLRAWFVGIVAFVILVAVAMTGSRAGLAIALLVALILAVTAAARRRSGMSRKTTARSGFSVRGRVMALAGVGVLAIVAAFTSTLGGLSRVADRFDFAGEQRFNIWADSWFAIGQVWPWGGGQGSFVPLLIAVERLEFVDRTR
ncbi:O-antigen ligase family protein [Croceicoccus sp. YJ47]|uniref:O-antigen ligase family protein n=1 Tax=Croceicoccus sp. YJ47 TaxID=2798724 RepID=UPI001923C03E|nr:O-antigen ligase family protein [Croceicoccus sp. YJ47]QQN72980.1 O-antigen ligase family protein [Croceicoccus sp. YJ47]